MKYTKTFKDTETGVKYFVSECCLDVDGDLRHLVLLSLGKDDVIEVSIGYEGVAIKQVGYVSGDFMEIGIEEFDKRFAEVVE